MPHAFAPTVSAAAVLALLGAWSAQPLRATEPPASASPGVAPAPAAVASQETFDILEFRVLGNHVLEPRIIERTVYPFLGRARSIDTVKLAAAALEKAYKDAGFGTVFVDIPEQEVAAGIVRLKVTEGTVERVRVRGERYFSGRQIRAALPALQAGTTPNLPALQEQLTALNARTPDRSLTPVLKAGSEPGTVDVDLNVKDTLPLHASLEVDDRHTASTTPNRATVAASYDNLWERQDSIALLYQTAPAKTSDAKVFQASYLSHVGSDGAQAAFSYTRTSSDVLAVGTLGVLGKGSIYGVHWIEPLVSTAATSQTFNAGADYKSVLTSVSPEPADGSSAGAVSAPVHYVNWSGAYLGSWWRSGQFYSLTAGVNFGVRGIVNSPDEFENARYNGNPDYFYVRLGFSGLEALPLGLALAQRISSQWADSPLVNNEQFALGGVDTVRGYLEAEALGDSGLAGSLEVHSPVLGPHAGGVLQPLYAFVFFDAGTTTLVNPLGGQRPTVTLYSSGAGLRLDKSHGWIGYIDVAVPLRAGITTARDQPRVNFSVSYGF